MFFIALYLLSFSSPLLSPSLLNPPSAAAQTNNGENLAGQSPNAKLFISPWSAGDIELARANKMDSTVPWILAVASFPVMFMKQTINVVQLVKASKELAEGDREQRRRDGVGVYAKSKKGQ